MRLFVGALRVDALRVVLRPSAEQVRQAVVLPPWTLRAEQLTGYPHGTLLLAPRAAVSTLLGEAGIQAQLGAGAATPLLGAGPAQGLVEQREQGLAVLETQIAEAQSVGLAEVAELRGERRSTARRVEAPKYVAAAAAQRERVLGDDEAQLFALAAEGDAGKLGALLEGRGEALLAVQHPRHGGTALHVATTSKSVDACRVLLDRGADANARAFNGSTPLHWAASGFADGVVDELLARGANPRATTYTWRATVFGKSSGQTALHWASEAGAEAVVRRLLEADPLGVQAGDDRETRPQDLSVIGNKPRVTRLLRSVSSGEYVCLELTSERAEARVGV